MDIDHSNASGPDDPDPYNPTISSASSSSTTSSAEYDEDAARSRRRRSIAVMVSSITIAAMEVASGLYDSDEASAGILPISRSPISSSSSRAKQVGCELSDIKDLLRMDLQLTKTNAEAQEERKRLKNERLERKRLECLECEHLEREPLELKRLECLKRERLEHERLECERLEHEHLEREGWLEHERLGRESWLEHERLERERLERKDLEHECLELERLECERLKLERLECERLELERLECEHLEQQKGNRQKTEDPMLDAIYQMQEVDSDLPPEHQAILADLFNKEHNSAKTYLALKSDPVRKAWIKHKLTQAGSG